jgi:hypothetical protein
VGAVREEESVLSLYGAIQLSGNLLCFSFLQAALHDELYFMKVKYPVNVTFPITVGMILVTDLLLCSLFASLLSLTLSPLTRKGS